jgi:hypothetical protein
MALLQNFKHYLSGNWSDLPQIVIRLFQDLVLHEEVAAISAYIFLSLTACIPIDEDSI